MLDMTHQRSDEVATFWFPQIRQVWNTWAALFRPKEEVFEAKFATLLPLPKVWFHPRTDPFLQRSCNKIFKAITTGAATPNGSYKEHITDITLLRVRLDGNVAQTLNQKRSLLTFQSTPSTRSVKSGFKSKAADIDRSATGILARTLRLLLSHFVNWNPPCLSKEQSSDTKPYCCVFCSNGT